jgi:hypothetical protein
LTKDSGYKIKAFAAKAKSALYPNSSELQQHTLGTHSAFTAACALCQSGTEEYWLSKLGAIDINKLANEIHSCPNEILSEVESSFMIALLQANKEILMR